MFIGRDCAARCIGEFHLRHLLRSYLNYYNETRTHLSLDKDAPVSRPIQVTKMVLSRLLVSHSNLALALVLLTAPAFAYDNPSRLPLGRFDAEVEIQRHLTRTRPSKCCWDTLMKPSWRNLFMKKLL